MTTRRTLLAAALAGGAIAPAVIRRGGAADDGTPSAETSSPNFIVIQVDDLDSALYDAIQAKLPAVSALAASGTSFDRYLVNTPLCSPSRATLLRGQYSHNTRVLWNRGEEGGSGGFEAFHRLGLEESTLATWLHSAGYRTGLIGKYLNNYPMGAEPGFVPPGWDQWAVHASDSREAFFFDYELNINGEIVAFGDAPEDYSTDVIAGLAEAFVRDAPSTGDPFFLFVTPYAPHDPANFAPRHAEMFRDVEVPRAPSWNEEDVSDKPEWVQEQPLIDEEVAAQIDEGYRNRLRSMLAVDEMVARLMATLDEIGQRANTFVLFTSDNGFHFGEHRVRFGKVTPYDESTRLPLVIAGPGVAPGGAVQALVSNADLAPTIAEWAGIAPPDFIDGRSIASLAAGEPVEAWRTWALLQQFEQIEERDHATPVPRLKQTRKRPQRGTPAPEITPEASQDVPARMIQADLPPFAALRGPGELYVEYETGEREYYDLESDPAALENAVASLTPGRAAALSAILAALARCAGSECREADSVSG